MKQEVGVPYLNPGNHKKGYTMLENLTNTITTKIALAKPILQFHGNPLDLIINGLFVTLLATIICLTYRYTYRGKDFRISFLQALFIITILLSFIMQIIGNSLARAFGMMGAVSIARFRTKVEDPKDTSFVLFAIGVGMAAGLNHHTLAVFITIFASLMIIIFNKISEQFVHNKIKTQETLRIKVKESPEINVKIENILEEQKIKFNLQTFEKMANISLKYNVFYTGEPDIQLLSDSLKKGLGEDLISFKVSKAK